jgi:hypothetical protein
MALLSYLASHWVLFILVVLSVAGLSAGAWFLKNWKLAAAAIVLTVAGLAYQAADMEGYKRKVSEDAQEQLSTLKSRLGVLQLVAQADAARQKADRSHIDQLETLSRETPHNDGACLDLDAARRVRAVRSAKPVPAPISPRRLTDLFQKRSGRP